jgi:hypothetical protein
MKDIFIKDTYEKKAPIKKGGLKKSAAILDEKSIENKKFNKEMN